VLALSLFGTCICGIPLIQGKPKCGCVFVVALGVMRDRADNGKGLKTLCALPKQSSPTTTGPILSSRSSKTIGQVNGPKRRRV